jgi:ABC-type nitrate/sulfonate/bicarbonate transport system ATPase subunit
VKLRTEKLAVGYRGFRILENLNMRVRTGEFVSILGPSGCGKSPLLNILAGILPSEEGRVLVDGETVCGISPHFAYMPQDDLLLPWRTILDNVCLYGILHGNKAEARRIAMDNMHKFGLSGYENRYPRELSGGMRQRAAFLRTALCAADIMLLDEPFAALDVITREDMQDWLSSMRDALSGTTVLVTHDVGEAIYLSDRILLLLGRPASFLREFAVPRTGARDRAWLLAQGGLRLEIDACLRSDLTEGDTGT